MNSTTTSRQALSLDGNWQFTFAGSQSLSGERTIRVPGVWQAQFPELRNSSGIGTYRRTVSIPDDWADKRVFLCCEGIFHRTTVLVDGHVVKQHENAWTAFDVELSGRSGSMEIEIRAEVPDDAGELAFLLHGKQDWYGQQGGIWKSVRLEAREQAHLTDLAVSTESGEGRSEVVVRGGVSAAGARSLRLEIGRAGLQTAQRTFEIEGEFEVRWVVDDPVLWSPEAPNLYEVTARLGEDAVTRTVGFRRFESRDGKLWLNGEPFYMFGALDQDWYPEEEARHPDPQFLVQRFKNAKAMGLNTLRCHVKIPDPLYLKLADELGLVVWLDMPYMEFLASTSRAQIRETFVSSVRDLGHHPSICIWTLMNEGWGIDLDDNPDDRAWLTDAFTRLKPLVPQSLLVDNSACFPRNYHLKTDIEDFHWYNSWPAQNAAFERTTNEFAQRPEWTFSKHGDAQRTGNEPLICSEFGVWGLPHPKDILERDGSEPWWFESGHDWNNGAALPHGMETRFRDARLEKTFGDLDSFVDHAQETEYRGLKYQIETLRYAEPISGYVITELNDTQWEANGLMDARNNIRRFGERLANLQQKWLVVARPARTALRAGESISVPVRLTGAQPLDGAIQVEWTFAGQQGKASLSSGRTGSLEHVIHLVAPAPAATTIHLLKLRALHASGGLVSENEYEFCVVPPLVDGPLLRPADEGAARILAASAYPLQGEEGVLVATQLTSDVREQLLSGRKVVLIANKLEALNDPQRDLPAVDPGNFPKMSIRERTGSYWDGRWMGAFTWRRTDGPWACLPGGPMLDEHWRGLLPNYVLTGFRSSAFGGLVDAGITVAWLHKAAALTKRTFLGKGWMTVSTFELTTDDALANPLAPHLLRAIASS